MDRSRGRQGRDGVFYAVRTGDRRQNSEDRRLKDSMIRPPAKCFEDLIVWQKAHLFVLSVYRLSADFPESEKYGLTSQLRRAAISVPANIAEGFKKKSKADKNRFMNIAQGSLEECRYYLILIRDLQLADSKALIRQLEEVSKLLHVYTASLLTSGS